MNKKEFKKIYSQYRKGIFNFNVKMQNGNFPCGYDDMLYDNFENHRNDFLKKYPIIKKVLELLDIDNSYYSGYGPITDNYKTYVYMNSYFDENNKRQFIKRCKNEAS